MNTPDFSPLQTYLSSIEPSLGLLSLKEFEEYFWISLIALILISYYSLSSLTGHSFKNKAGTLRSSSHEARKVEKRKSNLKLNGATATIEDNDNAGFSSSDEDLLGEGDIPLSTLYSKTSSITTGATPDLTAPMARTLTPNNSHLKVSHHSECGQRPYQEDRYGVVDMGTNSEGEQITFYGVFDGHGGAEASQYCVDRLALYIKRSDQFPDGDLNRCLTKAFLDIDDDFIATGKPDGTTVCVSIVFGHTKVVCANAGDSRSIVVKRGNSPRVVGMSRDHKPGLPDETKRITDLGGTVVYWGRWRVESVLAVSRAVGDAALMPYITAQPEIRVHEISQESEDDLFVVVASDGIWDVMSNEQVANFLIDVAVDKKTGIVRDDMLRLAGRRLCDEASRLGSGDNLSAVVVSLVGK